MWKWIKPDWLFLFMLIASVALLLMSAPPELMPVPLSVSALLMVWPLRSSTPLAHTLMVLVPKAVLDPALIGADADAEAAVELPPTKVPPV